MKDVYIYICIYVCVCVLGKVKGRGFRLAGVEVNGIGRSSRQSMPLN